MSAIKIIQALGRKIAAKKAKTPEGITQIQPQIYAESEAGSIAATLQDAGIPLDRLDDFIKSEQDLVRILNLIKSRNETMSIGEARGSGIKSTKSAKIMDMEGKEIDPRSKIMGGKQAETEAEIAARMNKQNKETAQRIRMKKMVDDAIDNSSPGFSGDTKYDATLVAEDLAERMGKVYDDLPQMERLDLYDKAYTGLSAQRYKGFKKPKDSDPEDMAQGGRAGFKIGGIDKARRAFLKAAAGIGGGIAALKTGLLNIGKGADTVKNLPPIKTPVTKLEGTTTEMPEWFPSFINKFRDEGKAENVFKQKKVAVSKAEYDQAAAEGKLKEGNYFMDPRTPEYIAKNPDHSLYNKLVDTDERIYTTYTNDKVPGVRVDDMDGNVDVMFENDYSQPVSLNYTAPGKRGPETGRADLFVQGEAKIETKPKGEFVANDVETYATDPDGGYEAVDVITNTVDDMLEGTTRQMEEYATGKKVKGISRGESRVIENEIRAEQAADAAAEAAADAAAEAADEFSSGGLAGMLGE